MAETVTTPEARGQATRAAILAAARQTFRRKGFHRATVDDITRNAKVAHGTFYRYFRNKQEALYGLMAQAVAMMPLPERDWTEADMFDAVRTDITYYFLNYWENRDLGMIWMEASSYDETVSMSRTELRKPFLTRISESIQAGIDKGEIPPIDVKVAAQALASMVEHFAYDWLDVDTRDAEIPQIAATIATIWCRGLGFEVPGA